MDSSGTAVTQPSWGTTWRRTTRNACSCFLNNYDLIGSNEYNSLTPGNRLLGNVQTAVKGPNPGPAAFANHIREATANYTQQRPLAAAPSRWEAYLGREVLPNTGSIGSDQAGPALRPDRDADRCCLRAQKQVTASKPTVAKNDFLIEGFNLNFGYDFNEDNTSQYLVLTNRVWLPNMALPRPTPPRQGSYDWGPLTFSGGARHQAGQTSVPTFRTLYETAPATDGVGVPEGSEKSYNTSVYNGGVVYRLPAGWSTFLGLSQGYDLPDIGTVIRNTNKPNQSINTVVAVDPILTTSYEAGWNWRGTHGNLGADVSITTTSPASTTVYVNPNTLPVHHARSAGCARVSELTGEWRLQSPVQGERLLLPHARPDPHSLRAIRWISTSPHPPPSARTRTKRSSASTTPRPTIWRWTWWKPTSGA